MTIAFVVAGGYVVAGPLKSPKLVLSEGASITLAAGWEFVDREPGRWPTVRVTNGTGNLDVIVRSDSSGPTDLAERYVEDVLRPQAARLVVSQPREERPDAGRAVTSVAYSGVFGEDRGAPFEGEISAVEVQRAHVGVLFDGWAEQGQYDTVAAEIAEMIRSLRPR